MTEKQLYSTEQNPQAAKGNVENDDICVVCVYLLRNKNHLT